MKRLQVDRLYHRRVLQIPALVSTAGLLVLALTATKPNAVSYYRCEIFPGIISLQTSLTNPLPFSLAEFLILSAVLTCVVLTAAAAVQLANRKRSPLTVLSHGFFALFYVGAPVLMLGYLLWGINYAGKGLIENLGWEMITMTPEESQEELRRACEQAVMLSNECYRRSVEGDPGRNTPNPNIDITIEEGFQRAFTALGISRAPAGLHSRAKPVYSSLLLSWLGISGFYFPWTGEASYNRLIPAPEKIHAIAHEKAHQRGITSEDEANFGAFLATTFSPDPQVRYAGYLFAQVQLLEQLARTDQQEAARLIQLRDPGVQRDRDASREFWARFEGRGMRMAASVNDSYLRLHGVEGGMDSYSRSARLLVLFRRIHGDLSP